MIIIIAHTQYYCRVGSIGARLERFIAIGNSVCGPRLVAFLDIQPNTIKSSPTPPPPRTVSASWPLGLTEMLPGLVIIR